MDILTEIRDDVLEVLGELETRERWWGSAAVPTEKNAIVKGVTNPFRVVSGNNAWGPVIQVIGSRDDPGPKGTSTYHLHRVMVAEQSTTTAWMPRFIFGYQSLKEAVYGHRWSEIMVIASVDNPHATAGAPIQIRIGNVPARQYKVWAQGWNATNLATLDFYIGCHGHDSPHGYPRENL
ncbi:MAG TPA: hypothetical protein VMW24_24735 [Sedimentisphaerales bacterium]|nr:hypothetical protein [Sedimentisphaerales bacterium]